MKQQVSELFGELADLIKKNLNEKGPGVFTIPDLIQIKWFASLPPRNTRGSIPLRSKR